jgi:hypothetical protein
LLAACPIAAPTIRIAPISVASTDASAPTGSITGHCRIGQGAACHGLRPTGSPWYGSACELCAGALAERYLELGGAVHYFGKPYASAYPPTLARLGVTDARRVLAIGDGLETDIRGARAAGLASLLVTGGILADALGFDRLAPPPAEQLAAACRKANTKPDAAIAVLRW